MLRPAADPQAFLEKLLTVTLQVENIRSSAGNPLDLVQNYLRWGTQASSLMRFDLPAEERSRLFTTARYESIQGLSSRGGPVVADLLSLELSERSEELRSTMDEVKQEIEEWGRGSAVAVVLDTNVLISRHENLMSVNWNRVINHRHDVPIVLTIAMKVIDELDGLKDRGTNDVRSKARAVIKSLEEAFEYGIRRELLFEGGVQNGRGRSHTFLKVIEDDPRHSPLPIADAEIVDRALSVSPFVREVWVVTNDTGMLFRARSAGLKASRLNADDIISDAAQRGTP